MLGNIHPVSCVRPNQYLTQLGDHGAALRVLALVLGDIRAAEAYCARWAGGEGHLALLDALLRPGDGRAPLYAEACHLLAAQGMRPMPCTRNFHDKLRLSEGRAPLYAEACHLLTAQGIRPHVKGM